VPELADVSLEVQPLDADATRVAVGQIDLKHAVRGERLLVLADLEVLRHVRMVVVLAREPARGVDAALERERRAHAVLDRAAIDHRQRPGHPLADGTGLRVRRGAKGRWAAAEHLGARRELRVHLEADNDVVVRYHPRLGRGVCVAVARSWARGARSPAASSRVRPMTCSPRGSPLVVKPHGPDTAGPPAMSAGMVNTSLRYICTGSVFSPCLNG